MHVTSGRRALGAVLLGVVLLLSGCSSLQGTGGKGYVSGDGTVRAIDVGDRSAPISLTGKDLDGKRIDLADYRGKPTVVNVWGSWCTECNAEADDLVAAARELRGTANFVGIDIRDPSPVQARAYNRRFGIDYPSIYSPDSLALLRFHGSLSTNAIPSTVVLDAQGRVAASIAGTVPSSRTLVDVVHDVAGGKSFDG